MKVREIARELGCSIYVTQALLKRAEDKRLDFEDAGWLSALPHRAARALLMHGFKSRADVAEALSSGLLSSDQPGVGNKTLRILTAWIQDEEPH